MSDYSRPNLILTVGIPGSGKSTWARRSGYPVVNPDSIRLAIHGQVFLAKAEPLVWSIARVMVMSLFGAGHKVVILDATNTTDRRRNEWKDSAWDTSFVLFPCDVEECKRRVIARGSGPELLAVIDRMAREITWPDGGKYGYDS